MMNKYQEFFISNYIISSKKKRLIYEIDSTKKKRCFIDHFCHDTKKFIISNKIIYEGELNDSFFIMERVKNEHFFVMSENYIDGITMDYNELKELLDKDLMEVIAISKKHVIIKEETEKKSNVYILE